MVFSIILGNVVFHSEVHHVEVLVLPEPVFRGCEALVLGFVCILVLGDGWFFLIRELVGFFHDKERRINARLVFGNAGQVSEDFQAEVVGDQGADGSLLQVFGSLHLKIGLDVVQGLSLAHPSVAILAVDHLPVGSTDSVVGGDEGVLHQLHHKPADSLLAASIVALDGDGNCFSLEADIGEEANC